MKGNNHGPLWQPDFNGMAAPECAPLLAQARRSCVAVITLPTTVHDTGQCPGVESSLQLTFSFYKSIEWIFFISLINSVKKASLFNDISFYTLIR
jgi:hypothetical protein